MVVRWLTAFIDRPSASFDSAARFWSAVTGSTLSPPRGEAGEFASLIPPDGDPYVRVQRVTEGQGTSHLDVHVDDIKAFARRAVAAGADEQDGYDVVVLRSPAGLPWCVVGHHGERVRPAPQQVGDTGCLHLVDQLCIDIPASRFDEECAFWSKVTTWELRQSSLRREFRFLVRPEGCPIRLLLQRCDDERPARAHLDFASTDAGLVVAHHQRLGATVAEVFDHWTVMTDPSGIPYCVTDRDPTTGTMTG
jgi:predicted enzyme related to lactoylglutathione lyase